MSKNYCGFTIKIQSSRKERSPSKKSQGRPQATGKKITVWHANKHGMEGEVCTIMNATTFRAAYKEIGPSVQKMGLHFPVGSFVNHHGTTFVPTRTSR